jgi:adenosylcobinamide kinase/adenosylcobinamide-phosphate guanylyltransferase
VTVELILGGARSGKSAHAEGLLPADAPARYVATARPYGDDAEFAERIAKHVHRRPTHWQTIETIDLARVFTESTAADAPLLVDDLATWVTGLIDDAGAWETRELSGVHAIVERTVDALARCACDVVLVSAEVGLGVIPSTPSGRLFRDELGAVNAAVAAQCDAVTLLVAGLPLRLR